MSYDRGIYKAVLAIAVLALLVPQALARGRNGTQLGQQPTGLQTTHAGEPVPEGATDSKREAGLRDDIEQLRNKVEQLQTIVEQQQRLLTELEKRLVAGNAKAEPTPLAVPARSKGGVAPIAQAVLEKPAGGTGKIILTASQAQPAQNPAGTQGTSSPVAGWDTNHAFLRSADGSFETALTGYAQLDYRSYQSGNAPPNTFLIRRARLALEGKLRRYYDFKVEGDFADTTSTLLRDFYVRVHRIDELQLSFGQFKMPISQEELRSDTAQDFVERSMVNNLVPSRSPGVMASGVIKKGIFEYQAGTFNGKGLLATNNNDTPESVVRLRFSPWRASNGFWVKGLSFGGAYSQGLNIGGTSVRGQTESRSFTFYTPDTVNGKVTRANGELTWLLGPAAIRAEYVQTNQERENLGPGGSELPGVVAKGYMAQFTYALTGENKPEGSIINPRRSLFDESNGRLGLGAWEVKFRYTNLQIANGTSKSNRAETFFFGPNWYLNRFVRYMLDLGIERFKDPVRTPNRGDRSFFVVLSRVQVSF